MSQYVLGLEELDARAGLVDVTGGRVRPAPIDASSPRAALANGLVESRVPAGAEVVHEGDPGDRFFVVADGELDVTCDGRELRRLHRGEGFGELALLRDVPRTATVTASTDARLYALGKACFLASVASHPRATVEAERLVDERLPAAQATIAP